MRTTQYRDRPQPTEVTHLPESVRALLRTLYASRVSSSSSFRSSQSRSSMRSSASSARRRGLRIPVRLASLWRLLSSSVAEVRRYVACVSPLSFSRAMSSDCAAWRRCFWSRRICRVTGLNKGSRHVSGKLTAPKPLSTAMDATPTTASREISSVMRSAPPCGRSWISSTSVRCWPVRMPSRVVCCTSLMGSVRRPIQNAVRNIHTHSRARTADGAAPYRRRRKL
mmetsp:Transcript_12486/g.46201  ORF Transcript_12486/g.46201 Transcript_12486/m.46201 type:complete len:225 (+) Transcript_12486:902-1576(+)